MTEAERLKVDCLTSIQAFETLWAYYVQSDGGLFPHQTVSACRTFLRLYEELHPSLPAIGNSSELRLGRDTDVQELVARLVQWTDGDRDLPYEEADKSRFMLFAFLNGVKSVLSDSLEVAQWPAHMTTTERDFAPATVRWRGHIPRKLLGGDPADLLESAGASDTIAVLADIRRSQDLMTYADSAEDFSARMIQFVSVTRTLTERQLGVFDKFTGDGFLIYFNEALCARGDRDFLKCFFWFIETYQFFARKHFSEWSAHVRKLPATPIGVAIGADVGRVKFVDVDGHFVAVGDPIVWASRLASAGQADDVLVNNLLMNRLLSMSRVSFKRRVGQTKTGEDFTAHQFIIEKSVENLNRAPDL